MTRIDTWPVIETERLALVTDLRAIPDEQWHAQSLCRDWAVHDVLAHMTATAKITPLTFFPKLVASGFSFGKLQAKDISREKNASVADTLENFEAVVPSRKHPPGPADTMLGETIIHAEDIRRALWRPPRLPARSRRAGGGLLQGLESLNRRQTAHRRAQAAGHGYRLVTRHRAGRHGSDHGPPHGHDRPQVIRRQPDRRGRGHSPRASGDEYPEGRGRR